MSLLDAYLPGLGESVTWKHRTGEKDQYNEPSYSDSTITVIWWEDERLIKGDDDEDLEQLAVIQTTAAIQRGDALIRNGLTYPIIRVGQGKNTDGQQFRIGSLGKYLGA